MSLDIDVDVDCSAEGGSHRATFRNNVYFFPWCVCACVRIQVVSAEYYSYVSENDYDRPSSGYI
jgi:hypothetical protein